MSDLDMTSTEMTRSETNARDRIESIDSDWLHHFKEKFLVEPALSRTLVSFQANKTSPSYRWYKFKEGFSAKLVEYLLLQYGIAGGTLLDPFAGSGTAPRILKKHFSFQIELQ